MVALVLLGMGAIDQANAAGHYYTFGGDPDGDWTNAANWGNSVGNPQAGYPDDLTDFAYLGGFPPGTNDLTILVVGTQFVERIYMQSTNHSYTIEGGVLSAGGSSVLAIEHDIGSTSDLTINCDLLLAAASRIRNRSSGPGSLTLNGKIAVADPGSLTVWYTGTGPIVLNGDNEIGDLTLTDGAHVVLGHGRAVGTNGEITVNATTGAMNAILGLTTNVTLDSSIHVAGGTLSIRVESGDEDFALTLDQSTDEVNMLSANGMTYILATNAAGGSGNITLRLVPPDTHDRTMDNLKMIVEEGCTFEVDNSDGDLLWDAGQGLVGGAGRFVKNGTNTLQIKRPLRHTGGTWINGGRLELRWHNDGFHGEIPSNGTCTVASGAVVDFYDAATMPYRVGSLAGAGTLELGGSTIEISEGLRFADDDGATLNIAEDGSVELGPDAWSVFELDSLANPNDQVVFSGTADLALDGVLEIKDLGGLQPGVYTLFTLGGGLRSGSFSVTNLPAGVIGTVSTEVGDVLLTITSTMAEAVLMIVR